MNVEAIAPDGGPGDAVHEEHGPGGFYAVWPKGDGRVFVTRHDPETGDALEHFSHDSLDHSYYFRDPAVARLVARKLAARGHVRMARPAEVAASYAPGIDPTPSTLVPDPVKSRAAGEAYAALRHDPTHPAVASAYDALKREVKAQWHHMTKHVKVTFGPEPYPSSDHMRADVARGHLRTNPTGKEMDPTHPLAEVDPDTGLMYNDMFRAVHDYFGHAVHPHSFGARGEIRAWEEHAKMFSPEARRALTTETHGQNSWVNFGPHSHLPVTERPYAEQKAALLPEEHWPKRLSRSRTLGLDESGAAMLRGLPPGAARPGPGFAAIADNLYEQHSGHLAAERLTHMAAHPDTVMFEGTPHEGDSAAREALGKKAGPDDSLVHYSVVQYPRGNPALDHYGLKPGVYHHATLSLGEERPPIVVHTPVESRGELHEIIRDLAPEHRWEALHDVANTWADDHNLPLHPAITEAVKGRKGPDAATWARVAEALHETHPAKAELTRITSHPEMTVRSSRVARAQYPARITTWPHGVTVHHGKKYWELRAPKGPERLARTQAPAGGAVVNNQYQAGGRFLASPLQRIRTVAALLKRLRVKGGG